MKLKKKFCPVCGSDNIKWQIPQNWSVWECHNCGYVGAIVVEEEELARELQEEYKKEKGTKE